MAVRHWWSGSLLAVALGVAGQGDARQDVGLPSLPVAAGPMMVDTAEQRGVRVDVIARGLDHGYRLAFLPNGDALVVERGKRIRVLRAAAGERPMLVVAPIGGVPAYGEPANVHPDDVLGIQDVIVGPDFAATGRIYYSYNRPGRFDRAAKRLLVETIIATGRLRDGQLVERRDLVSGEPVVGAGGSRLAFGRDGMLYASIGGLSIGDIQASQRTDNLYGKVLRIAPDGSIPHDNPLVGRKGARAEIYSFGHRDPLGLAVEPRTGAVIASEHGPQGGDELNRILSGRNYGWPTWTYGTDYGDSPLPTQPVGPGIEPPLTIWTPAIAPTGILFYTGTRFPAWKNNLFIASARRGEINGTGGIVRVVLNDRLQEVRQETLLGELRQRFKDLAQGPDGRIYALTDEADSVVLRLSPGVR